jgi:hypothetical protein
MIVGGIWPGSAHTASIRHPATIRRSCPSPGAGARGRLDKKGRSGDALSWTLPQEPRDCRRMGHQPRAEPLRESSKHQGTKGAARPWAEDRGRARFRRVGVQFWIVHSPPTAPPPPLFPSCHGAVSAAQYAGQEKPLPRGLSPSMAGCQRPAQTLGKRLFIPCQGPGGLRLKRDSCLERN